jgi:anti-anti-sigma factor
MDCAGSNLLLDAYAWARAAAVELVIIQGHRAVRRLLEVARVDHVLPLIDRQPVESIADSEHGLDP